MASEAAHLLAKCLNRLSTAGRLETLPDRVLIERFVSGHEEDAFTVLVRRHGPMVLRVCHRILHDSHAAEDVFQATFLVLSRKAASLRCADSVGCWIHGVAYRLAHNARLQRARRWRHEGQAARDRSIEDPLAELSVREAQAILDEELSRLPEKYRAPLIACCLEGRTRDEAARELGWPVKLIKSRLEQGRERLRMRLSRRHLTIPAVLIATTLAEDAAPAAVPAALIRAAVETARTGSSNGVSPSVALLAQDAIHSMGAMKVKAIVGLLLLTGVLAVCLGGFALPQPGQQAGPLAAVRAPQTPKVEKQTPMRMDRYGDPLPSQALARLGTVRFRPGDPIAHIAFSPDDKLLAVATQNMEGNANPVSISLWDRVTGKRLRQFGHGRRPPSALAFTPDGKTLAAQDQRGDIHLWDLRTGQEVRCFTGNIAFSRSPLGGDWIGAGFTFSPDGKSLAARGPDKAIHLWDTATAKDLRKLAANPEDSSPLAFTHDGKILATSADKMVRFWNPETGKEIARLMGHEGLAGTPAFSADGKTFTALARTPGDWGRTAYTWDIATSKLLHKWDIPESPVWASCISPDGKTVLMGREFNRLRCYDLTTGKEVRRLVAPFTGAVFSIAFSLDGKTIAAGGENRVLQLWDAASSEPLTPFAGHQGWVQSLALSANGKYLASIACDERIVLWDMKTAQPVTAFSSPQGRFCQGRLALSPDDRTLAVVGLDPFVRLIEVPSGKEVRRFPCAGDSQMSVVFSPDGRILAAGSGYTSDGSRDKCIRLWETATGKLLHQFKPPRAENDGGIPDLAFSPDGRLLASADSSGDMDIWDVIMGKLRCRIQCHRPNIVDSLAFSPDGRILATASSRDKAIRLWEVWSGQSRGSITGHVEWVNSLAFSPSGLLASASHDKIVRIWDLFTSKETGCFRGHDSVVGPLAFSSDGRRLISGGWDTTILVWDMNTLPHARSAKAGELSPKELEACWADLADADASKAFRSIRTLIRARQQAVSLLKEHLRPIAPVAAEEIGTRIADLDSEQFEKRSRAEGELEKLEELAEPALRRVLREKPSSLELRRRVEALLNRLERPITSKETLRRLRAVEILEHIGTAEARHVLQTLATGAPAARPTREANAALGRLTNGSPLAR